MRAKYFDGKQKVNINIIEEIAEGILSGKSAVFPTETVYGIGANALVNKACENVFEIKGRPNNKPLIILISNLDMLNGIIAPMNEVENKLIEKFWPGPLTIVLDKSKDCKISEVVTAGKPNIGVRMTSGEIASLIIKKAGVPIVAPSANLSGKPTGTKIDNIIEKFGDKVDYILDCGDIESDVTSTVVEVKDDIICVLRQGKIGVEELEEVAKVKII